MKIVLIGLPFCGKSTVFRALMGKQIQSKASAVGKIQLHIGTLEVKDERLKNLGKILNSEKITYPKINLMDLTNLGEKTVQGIQTSYIREFDALALIVAAFSSQNPVEDLKNIESELILADMQLVQNRIERINKEKKAQPRKEDDPELLLLKRCAQALEKETSIKDLKLKKDELKMLAGFQFLTLKPMIVVANISEEQLNKKEKWQNLEQQAKNRNMSFFSLCAQLESEIEELSEKERPQFLKEMGLTDLSRDRFIQICLQAWDRILFFTVVGKEARAWPVARGTTALEAAGCVHSDMERGFIRAEVINYQDFIKCGSFAKGKEKGLLRLESKEYPVQDADIINFKFSV